MDSKKGITIIAISAISFIAATAGESFAQVVDTSQEVAAVQQALREFGFYQGKVNGKTSRDFAAALDKYSNYVRSKGWSDATGGLAEAEIDFLLQQYHRRINSIETERAAVAVVGNASDQETSEFSTDETSGSSASARGGASGTATSSGPASSGAGKDASESDQSSASISRSPEGGEMHTGRAGDSSHAGASNNSVP